MTPESAMNRPEIVGDLINFLAQSQIETFDFTALRESLYYTTKTRTVEQIVNRPDYIGVNRPDYIGE